MIGVFAFCCAISSTDGGGVLIFFLFSAQNIDVGESGGEGGRESYIVVLTTFYFM